MKKFTFILSLMLAFCLTSMAQETVTITPDSPYTDYWTDAPSPWGAEDEPDYPGELFDVFYNSGVDVTGSVRMAPLL